MKPPTKEPWRVAIDALDFIGRLDALQKQFCQSALLTTDMLAEARWMQNHIEADRKAAVRKLKAALDTSPLPFPKLPDDLRWIRGDWMPPCYISEADRQALIDLIGPDLHAREETE